MIRHLIVEDDEIVRDAIASLLHDVPDIEVVATASRIRDAWPLLDRHLPDVVLADLALVDGSGVELVRCAGRRRKRRVLILTGHSDAFAANDALARGAAGYMLKSQGPNDLLLAIRTIAMGSAYIAPEVVRALALLPSDARAGACDSPAGLTALSHREHDVFRQLVAGYDTKHVAQRLCVSLKTIETHRTNINRKLAVRTTADLIRYAVGNGITVAPRIASEEVLSE